MKKYIVFVCLVALTVAWVPVHHDKGQDVNHSTSCSTPLVRMLPTASNSSVLVVKPSRPSLHITANTISEPLANKLTDHVPELQLSLRAATQNEHAATPAFEALAIFSSSTRTLLTTTTTATFGIIPTPSDFGRLAVAGLDVASEIASLIFETTVTITENSKGTKIPVLSIVADNTLSFDLITFTSTLGTRTLSVTLTSETSDSASAASSPVGGIVDTSDIVSIPISRSLSYSPNTTTESPVKITHLSEELSPSTSLSLTTTRVQTSVPLSLATRIVESLITTITNTITPIGALASSLSQSVILNKSTSEPFGNSVPLVSSSTTLPIVIKSSESLLATSSASGSIPPVTRSVAPETSSVHSSEASILATITFSDDFFQTVTTTKLYSVSLPSIVTAVEASSMISMTQERPQTTNFSTLTQANSNVTLYDSEIVSYNNEITAQPAIAQSTRAINTPTQPVSIQLFTEPLINPFITTIGLEPSSTPSFYSLSPNLSSAAILQSALVPSPTTNAQQIPTTTISRSFLYLSINISTIPLYQSVPIAFSANSNFNSPSPLSATSEGTGGTSRQETITSTIITETTRALILPIDRIVPGASFNAVYNGAGSVNKSQGECSMVAFLIGLMVLAVWI